MKRKLLSRKPVSGPQPSWFVRNYHRLYKWGVWTGFFLILYLFSNFLSLIFLTFILTFSINSLVNFLGQRFNKPRLWIIVSVYSVLGISLVGFGMVVFPKVYQEGKTFTREIPEAKDKLIASIREIMADENYSQFIEGIGIEDAIKEKSGPVVQGLTNFVQSLLRISFHFILSVIFSFIILWDYDRLRKDVKGLKETRFHRVYRILSPKLAQFADILGKAFEAQIMIAMLNTLLTLIGLWFLGIPSKFLLSVLVFFCSFVPVLGVFLSSVPICLLAYKTDGFVLAFYAIILITIIHFIEAYILNPRIVGGHLSLHPFVAVSILVFSEYCFGVWGLLLGVPCSVFLYQSFVLRPLKGGVVEPESPQKNVPVVA